MPSPDPSAAGGSDLKRALTLATGVLDRLDIPYAIIGGVASDQWGFPRMTYDLDLIISVEKIRLPRLLDAWAEAGFQFDAPVVIRELSRDTISQIRFGRVPVDIWLPAIPLHHEILKSRRGVEVLGRRLWFAAPEMLMVLKMIAGRSKDWEDIKGILALNAGRLDMGGIRHWMRQVIDSDEAAARFERMVAEYGRPES